MSKYLYGISVKGIQDFIFSTNELKSIIGGSGLIESFKIKTKDNFDENYIDMDLNISDENIIINAAGNIKIIFDESQKEELKKLALTLPKQLKQSAYGVEVCQSVIKFEEGELYNAFDRLEEELGFERNKPNIPLDYSNFFIKIAPKSGRPESLQDKGDIATKQKFDFCDKKLKEDKELGLEIKTIPKNSKNKTAIIHADGNSLGAKISKLKNETDKSDKAIKDIYKTFSKKLENATNKAFDRALKSIGDEKNRKRIRKVVLGGDDLTVICSADIALEFTNEFIKAFEEETEKSMDGKLTMCAGVAFCNHKFPFYYAVRLAENLCSYAKEKSRSINDKIPPSSVMFHNIQSSSISSYSDIIKTELTFSRTKNSYDMDDYNKSKSDLAKLSKMNEKDKKLCVDNEIIALNFGPYFINQEDIKENLFLSLDDFLELSKMFLLENSPKSRIRDYLDILEKDPYLAKERIKRIQQMINIKSQKKDDEFSVDKFNDKFKFADKFSFTNPFVIRCIKSCESDNSIAYFTPFYDILSHLSVVDK